MKKEVGTRIKLTAGEGCVLTDGENYGCVVFLALGDEGEKWQEIREEEYGKILAEKERDAIDE